MFCDAKFLLQAQYNYNTYTPTCLFTRFFFYAILFTLFTLFFK